MSYNLSQNDPVTILSELNTGKSEKESGIGDVDVSILRDSNKSTAVFPKLEVLPPSVAKHSFRYQGARVSVSTSYSENLRCADFYFLEEVRGRNEEQYFYIHVRNGRRIIRYMNGKVDMDFGDTSE